MNIFSVFFMVFAIVGCGFDVANAQLSTAAKIGLVALGGATVDRTFFRQQPANNYYYSYPGYNSGYYTYGKKK